MKTILHTASCLLISGISSHAALVFNDFSTFPDGNLVGQQGWAQFGGVSANPVQVSGGAVTWPGGATSSNQDVINLINPVVPTPETGTTTVYLGFVMSVLSAGTNPSYFAATSILASTSTTGNFANSRLSATNSGTGFVFGARVTGQGGYQFAFGTEELDFSTEYTLVAEVNMVAGPQNDFIRLFVNPTSSDFSSQVPYAVAAYSSGSATDPASIGGLILSQFGSATVAEPGVRISRLVVTQDAEQAFLVIPEPSALMLSMLGLAAVIRRRRVV